MPELEKLVRAIVSYVVEHDAAATKTKLLKLLYLFDLEHFRIHRRTLTGFTWKYFHLGPWAREWDSTLDGLVARQILQEQSGRYGTSYYRPIERVDVDQVFPEYRDERILRDLLKTWGEAPTAEILDHIYFNTEPMLQGIRNEPLDFSLIPESRPTPYERSSSGKGPEEIRRLREEFRRRRPSDTASLGFEFTPPRYDEEYLEAVELLDSM